MINIIGGGLAGLAAGISLVSRGENATIFEQHKKVGMQIGRDVMAIRNYGLPYDQMQRFNDLGLNLKHSNSIKRIIKYAPSGKKMELYSSGKPLFYVILRDSDDLLSFDTQLANKFETEGGKIIFNTRKNFNEGNIIASKPNFASYWCAGIEVVDVNIDPETILFFMDNDYAPQGYIALIPWGKHEFSLGIAILSSTNFRYNFTHSLSDLLNKFILKNEVLSKLLENSTISNNFAGSSYSNIPKSANIKNKLFVGAAAGFLDAARAFGVKYSLESGVFAGQAIAEKIDYDKLWKDAFENDLLSNFNRRLALGKMTNSEYEQVIVEDRLTIEKYDKFSPPITNSIRQFELSIELEKWRHIHDLDKIINY